MLSCPRVSHFAQDEGKYFMTTLWNENVGKVNQLIRGNCPSEMAPLQGLHPRATHLGSFYRQRPSSTGRVSQPDEAGHSQQAQQTLV